MNIRNRRNPVQKVLKDYMVPIIWWLLILILLFSLFSWWNEENNEKDSNETPYIIMFDNENTEAYIEKLSWKKDKITNQAEFYKWEVISVKKWSIEILVDNIAKFRLSSSWILEYKKDWSFKLTSWNLWVESISNFSINTMFWKIKLIDWSIVNISQYDTSLALYDFTGKAEVENNAWINTILSKWEEIEIWTVQASDSEIDLSLLKTKIKDTFKASPWYIKNWWDELLSQVNSNETSTWSNIIKNNNLSWLISFENLSDELYVSESSIDIEWSYDSLKVWKITINWTKMNLNSEKSTFDYKWFSVNNSENDLIIKIYDIDESLLKKYVLTVYNSNISSNNSNNNSKFKVTTFDIDASQIKFTAPSTTWMYTTTGDEITIKWSTPAWTFASITVNDYKLKSFNWTSWKYHAFTRFNNLDIWTNQYKINYFDDNGKVIYTNYFDIVKKDPNKKTEVVKNPSKYSEEVKID